MSYTPGPWEWDAPVWDCDAELDVPWLVDGNGEPVLSGEIKCSSQANARLIAASPELEKALQVWMALPHEMTFKQWVDARAETRAALEKAGVEL